VDDRDAACPQLAGLCDRPFDPDFADRLRVVAVTFDLGGEFRRERDAERAGQPLALRGPGPCGRAFELISIG